MSNERILVVEDDVDINDLLCDLLKKNGYEVTAAYSGTEAKMCIKNENYQIVLLDLMLPGIKGESLIEEIRKEKVMPIIVISAKTSLDDKVNVLRLGADDFVGKPFNVDEVLARVQAQLRRYTEFAETQENPKILKYKNIVLNNESREASVNDNLVNLTLREYDILELLMSNPKKVFTRANIFQSVWKSEFLGDDNTVNVHVSNLRSKLASFDKDTEYIQTVWGIGFKLKE
ncbi:response regulator transcription factor [Inconstantimicrobium mannanitabidum]|uniref:DNA-binding response regulator n=1 Tax=Inconstantimicrobium mannanitabidum TaxID=1604901 RepID=A0ACB5RG94_9CLOT|nr:response regulator transcription factor [Clostridium sp. TW13]GKX68116.1 DNA-binding response regulator [Clostridium sp. TW13]